MNNVKAYELDQVTESYFRLRNFKAGFEAGIRILSASICL